MAVFYTSCPLDCPDGCRFEVRVSAGEIISLKGDRRHPLTRGFLCPKGNRLLTRLKSPQRITYPLLKIDGSWRQIAWKTAYDLLAERITKAVEKWGSTSIMLFSGYGSGGRLNLMDQRLFNMLGGATLPSGSMCWGSGYKAGELDFGRLKLHDPSDILASRLIVLWGRDPHTTSPHLVPLLKQAEKKGAKLMVVNPVAIRAADEAEIHLRPYPGTDGALALAMAHVILSSGHYDSKFIAQHTSGFSAYKELVLRFPPEKGEEITGVPADEIRKAALFYAENRPAAILLGYGMQRYANGGESVRLIDALAALTGNLGISGGGVNYAHQIWQEWLNDITAQEMATSKRGIPLPVFSNKLQQISPPVEIMFVTRSNPVNQLPDTNRTISAFSALPFLVVVDMFMTDTARYADLFLPCTSFLEEENLIASSWHYELHYNPRIIAPKDEARPDHVIFRELGRHMGLPGFEKTEAEEWIAWLLEPLKKEFGLCLDDLKRGPWKHPEAGKIPWKDGIFAHDDGLFHFFNGDYHSRHELPDEEFPFHLITPHRRDRMHSQFCEEDQDIPCVLANPEDVCRLGLKDKTAIWVISRRGKIKAHIKSSTRIPQGVVCLPQGSWISRGGGVNYLTPQLVPDLGDGTPYYDCCCRLEADE